MPKGEAEEKLLNSCVHSGEFGMQMTVDKEHFALYIFHCAFKTDPFQFPF